MTEVEFCAVGGYDEVGKNMNAIRVDDEVIILDSSPLLLQADTMILATMVDEVLLVLETNVSRIDLAKRSKQALKDIGVKITGFTLNKAKTVDHKYY